MDTLFPLKTDTASTDPIKTKALCHLMNELDAGVTDSTCYSEKEVYHIFEVENGT